MCSTTPYYLPLDEATLVFFPFPHTKVGTDTATSQPSVVQVSIKTRNRKYTLDDLATFFLAQSDITKAVESILLGHLISPLPVEIVVEGRGYTLHGRRMEWEYGQGAILTWGTRIVRICEDRWTFTFEVNDAVKRE